MITNLLEVSIVRRVIAIVTSSASRRFAALRLAPARQATQIRPEIWGLQKRCMPQCHYAPTYSLRQEELREYTRLDWQEHAKILRVRYV